MLRKSSVPEVLKSFGVGGEADLGGGVTEEDTKLDLVPVVDEADNVANKPKRTKIATICRA
jgi:hypothetical protein